jgi:hypothetical protein
MQLENVALYFLQWVKKTNMINICITEKCINHHAENTNVAYSTAVVLLEGYHLF